MNIIKDIKKFIINKLNKSDRNVNLTQENLKQKQYNDNIENKEKINEIIDALETVDSSVDTINNDISDINTSLDTKVNKSGDTMTGTLKVPQLAANCNYDTNKGGAIQSNGNLNFMGSGDSINWKEVGYGDKFRIVPSFGGADDSNNLLVQGTVGGAGEDPTNWKNLFAISAKSGNIASAGTLRAGSFSKNTSDTWIPVINSGLFDYTLRAIWSSKQHTNYNTNQEYLATLSTLSWWNGAYASNGSSNLTYCSGGEIQPKGAIYQFYLNSTGQSVAANANIPWNATYYSRGSGISVSSGKITFSRAMIVKITVCVWCNTNNRPWIKMIRYNSSNTEQEHRDSITTSNPTHMTVVIPTNIMNVNANDYIVTRPSEAINVNTNSGNKGSSFVLIEEIK